MIKLSLCVIHVFTIVLQNLSQRDSKMEGLPTKRLGRATFRTVKSKPPTIPLGTVACTFSDNLSRHSCIFFEYFELKGF